MTLDADDRPLTARREIHKTFKFTGPVRPAFTLASTSLSHHAGMNISSTKFVSTNPKPTSAAAPPTAKGQAQPQDQVQLSLVEQIAKDPLPEGSRFNTLVPTFGGLAVGVGAGIIGGGIGAGAALPAVGILGVAGAALGSKIDHAGGKEGRKWTTVLAAVGAGVGAAGVVAGAVGGTAGAVASGLSLAGTGFALGHLLSHR